MSGYSSPVAFARVVRAGVQKNWRLSVTYPSWIINRLVSPLVWVSISVYGYLALAEPDTIADAFAAAGEVGSFTGFLILGQTVFSFFMGLNWRGGMAIQRERWYGTLELVMLAPTSRVAYVLGEGVFGLLDSGWTVFLAMVLAFMIFGAGFDVAHPLAALVVVALTLAAMLALGVFLAGFYVLTRAAGPMSTAIQQPVRFLSGVQFPLAALPAILLPVAYALPVTWGLLGVRRVLLGGAGFADVWGSILGLAAMTAFFLLAGAWLIERMERRAKRTGSLHAY